MPDLLEASSTPRRPPVLLFGVFLVAAVFLGGGRLLDFYVDALWFSSLGYTAIFRETLLLEWGVFGLFFALTFALLFGSFLLLRGARSGSAPGLVRFALVNGQPITIDLGRWLRPAVLLGCLFAAWISGSTLSSEWPTFARWLHAPHGTSVADPVLGHSLNFYLLTLPAWQSLAGWLTAMSLIVLAIAAGLHIVRNRPQLQDSRFIDAQNAQWRGVYGAVALFLASLAVQAWLARFGLLLEDHTIFSGVTYTDAHVQMPGLILVAIALLLGALFLVYCGVRRSGVRWIAIAALPGVLLYVGMQLTGAAVNTFIVKPNELVKEQPYIRNNITATRQAYALDRHHSRRCGRRQQSADPAEYPSLGCRGAPGHAAADSGNSDLL
jgi:uncharacterized membrane protein (UPF0182 family)